MVLEQVSTCIVNAHAPAEGHSAPAYPEVSGLSHGPSVYEYIES